MRNLFGSGKNAQNLAVRAFSDDLEGAAANFAVGGEALVGDAGIDRDIEGLAAVGALNGSEFFHLGKIAATEMGVQSGAGANERMGREKGGVD